MIGVGIGIGVKLAAGGFAAALAGCKAVCVLLFTFRNTAGSGYVGAFAAMDISPVLTALRHRTFAVKRMTVGFDTAAAVVFFSETAFIAKQPATGLDFYFLHYVTTFFILINKVPMIVI